MRQTVRIRAEQEPEPERDQKPREVQPSAAAVLELQRTAGNQAVTRALLQRNGPEAPAKAPAATFEDAVKAGEWERATTLLGAEKDDAQIAAKIKPLPADQLAKLDAAAVKAGADRVHRHISFLLHAPAKGVALDEAKVNKPGTVGHTGKAGGGDVEAHTGVEYEPAGGGTARPAGFSVGYKGADADKSHWLQFIWREMVVEDPVKGTFSVDEEVQSTAKNKYRFTTDSSKPVYNTDTNSDKDPFYEAGFFDNRSADSTTIFDFPSSFKQVVKRQFDAGAKKVTSRAHFNTYLVRDMQVLYKVSTNVEWEFTSADVEPPRKQTQSGGSASAIDAAMRKKLVEQYPDYDYLP